MAFLTLIAPLVAMTYPLDKLSDGKAQAFNMWFKEYMFTLLIQPVHALLYMVFVNMAMDFASKNTIYAIVAIGFILQAERIIRKFFGFDKAGAFPIMNSALGGAMVMQGMSWLKGRGRKGPKGEGAGGEKGVRVKPSDRGSSNDMDALGVLLGGTPPVSGGTGGAVASAPRTVETNSFEDAYGGGSSYTPFSAPASPVTSATITPHNTPSSPKTKPSFGKKLRSYGKTIGKNAVLKGSNAIARGTAKVATKLPLAATLGTIGIAAGLASDNDANILKYGAAGAGIGWSLGRTPDGKGWAAIQDEAMLDAYGSDYKEYLNQKSDKEFMNDPAMLREYGGDREKMEKALEYRTYGITDNKIIKRAMKLSGYRDEDKFALAKLASEISSHKDLEAVGKGMRLRGATEEQTEELLKALRELKGYSF